MRIHTVHLEISGITRVVINRVSVWEQDTMDAVEGQRTIWRKISGGPGYTSRQWKTTEAFQRMIARLLDKQIVIRKWEGHDVCTEQYRAWVSGNTLNIVQRDPKEWAP